MFLRGLMAVEPRGTETTVSIVSSLWSLISFISMTLKLSFNTSATSLPLFYNVENL